MPDATLEMLVGSLHKAMERYRDAAEDGSRDEVVYAAEQMHNLAYSLNTWLAEQGMLSEELAAKVPWIGYMKLGQHDQQDT